MGRPKNFTASTRVSWNISKEAAQMLRVASAQTGMSPAAVMDLVIRKGLHLVIEGGNQVVVEPPAPRKVSAPAPAKPAPGSWRQSFPLVPPDGDGTVWTPDSLQAALDQVRRKRSELQQILGLTNVDIWWSPPKAKGVPPSVPSKHWPRIDQALRDWGWVKSFPVAP